MWLFLPENLLHSIGIGEFLPQKYWAVALPIYFSVAFFLFVFIVYPSLGLLVTPKIKDIRNITDEFAIYNTEKDQDKEKIPRVYDLHPCDLIQKND